MTRRGIGGHHSAAAKTVEWLTPPFVLAELGRFDLDPCAPVNRPWDTAAHHYTIEDNGLVQPWFGRVWLNPPYGRACADWLERMTHHGIGTALIFARTETDMFFRSVWSAASAVLFLRGRLNFHLPNGARSSKNAGGPSVLIAYGDNDADILSDIRLAGHYVSLRIPFFPAAPRAETWKELIGRVLGARKEETPLRTLYALLSGHPKTEKNPNWQAKVRQIVQGSGFTRVRPGVYIIEGAST